MTRELQLTPTEGKYRNQILETARDVLGTDDNFMVEQNLPRKAAITNNVDFGYFLKDGNGAKLSELFYDKIFDELWTRIMQP